MTSATRSGQSVAAASVLRAFWALFAIKTSLKARGFRSTLAHVERRRDKHSHRIPGTYEEVQAVARSVSIAAAFYPGRALCLEQSLALYAILVERFHDVSLRFGIQPRPFAAHAWVEYKGDPVDEEAERLKLYAPFPTLVP